MNPLGKTHPLLDPEAIQKAEYLGLQARTIVEGYMAGAHQSPFRGFAVEFAQHREYVPGDDTRHLDWKVLGRSDRYYIKQYEQETNFVAHLLLDGSESMKYGSGRVSKLDYAKVMAACLAYLILLQRDAAAVTVFDSQVREHQPRTDSLAKIHQICSVLSAFNPNEPTAISNVMEDLARKTRRRGIVILISDLLDDEEKLIRGLQHLRFTGHEVIVFHVLDPFELSFPFNGNVEFVGLEQQGHVLTRPAEIRKSYLAEFGAFLDRIRLACERNDCPYVKVTTDQPWAEILTAWLGTRQHRYG
ncbi:MAG TPA: DUF58 domain-containing protein [Chthoniobacteraceae bacterium]|nr:DUF58 domain-containing protein [Chthoniobacteraceae bacterium]